VAGIGFGLSVILGLLDVMYYSILLPIVITLGTLVIMLCPWPFLTKKNLMLVVFYILVATPLATKSSDVSMSEHLEERPKWFLASFIGTISVGLCVSVSVHFFLLLTPRSTTATRLSLRTMNQLSHSTYHLLASISLYANSLGKDLHGVMRARALIESYTAQRKQTLSTLSGHIDGIHAEFPITKFLRFVSNDSQLFCHVNRVEEFLQCAKRQQHHADIIRLATSGPFLGEEYTHMNEMIMNLKTMVSEHLGVASEQIAMESQQAERSYFFTSTSRCNELVDDLKSSMGEYILAIKRTYHDSDKMTSADEFEIDSSAKSLIGAKLRVRVVQIGVYNFVLELIDVMTKAPDEQVKTNKFKCKKIGFTLRSALMMPWLHKNPMKLRMALKTSFGMFLASMWVSIPYLREEIAYPNSMWPGITVAVISLEQTGSTVLKCYDRMWGTMIAGACALLVTTLLPSTILMGITAYAILAFVSILVKNPERAYANECAVTSLASILFGSYYNDSAVDQYVTQRIMLIFIGVSTFLVVELAIFPRSSRRIVEACALKWFEDLRGLMVDASEVSRSISSFQCKDCDVQECTTDDFPFMLHLGHNEISPFASNLVDKVSGLKETIAVANKELQPAISEPSLGLHVKLHGIGYEKLLHQQERCTSQVEVLITCMNAMIGYYSCLSEDALVRELRRPEMIAEIINQLVDQLQSCIHGMKLAFPRGLCEPGSCSVSSMIALLSHFRSYEAIRVSILTKTVADNHAEYFKTMMSSDMGHTTGFRTTIALAISTVLAIAQCLQFCGLHLEEIVRYFPLENSRDFAYPEYNDQTALNRAPR